MAIHGIYVHVPFCVSKCAYCAFVSTADLEHQRFFVDALIREIALRADPSIGCGSIHFGGGTPTSLPDREIARVLSVLLGSFDVAGGAEIALEANPGTADASSLCRLREAGFNRLSLGVQSFDDSDLRFLGRAHDSAQSVAAYWSAREAGFDNIGIDLIWGLPDRGTAHWESQMESAAALNPEHVSCYCLTVEPGTRLDAAVREGRVRMPSDELSRELFLLTHRRMNELGYPAYEVSNFSRLGQFPSRHNSSYWSMAPYFGFGPAAHSHLPPRRSWNVASLDEYVELCVSGLSATGGSEELTPEQSAMEMVSLGIRTTAGADLEALERLFAPGFRERNSCVIRGLVARSLAHPDAARLRLTTEGMAVADGLAAEFDYGQ